MITMKEIAKLTGVSQATVSRVLSGNTSVQPDIRRRVLDCAKEHNYQPNIIAQSLVGNKSLLLGVVIPDISNPFFADLVKAIEEETSRFGYSILLFNTDYQQEKELKYLNILHRYHVDGILLVPCHRNAAHLADLKKGDIPVVVVTQNAPLFDSVYISHYEAGRQVARHFLNIGYSSFIYVGDPGDEKERGFKEELTNEGIDTTHHYFSIPLIHNIRLNSILDERIQKEKHTDGIAIFAYNDVEALIVLHALQDIRAKIPDQVALAGFDNTFISKGVSPTITSVAQPIEEIGRLGVSRLLELIDTSDSGETEHVELSTRIIARESSITSKRV